MTLAAYQFSDIFNCSRTSTGCANDNTGTLQDIAAATPRIDFDPVLLTQTGLLIEEARQNLCTNPRMVGGVAGSPGTPPTNMTLALGIGLTTTLAYGTELGRDYVDVTHAGTTSGVGPSFMYLMSSTESGAIDITKAYTTAVEAKLSGGSLSGVGSIELGFVEYASNGTTNLSPDINPTPMALSSTRSVFTFTKSTGINASAVYLRLAIRFQFTAASVAVNFTIRLYLPKLVRGSYGTSAIRPTPGTVASFTRQADDIALRTGAFSSFLGTLTALFGALEFMLPQAAVTYDQGLLRLDDGTENNKITLVNLANTSNIALQVSVAGTQVVSLTLGAMTPGSIGRAVFSGTAGSWLAAFNGSAVQTSNAAFPSGLSRLLLGRSSLNAGRSVEDGATMANGYIRGPELGPTTISSDQVAGGSNITAYPLKTLLTAGGAPSY